MTDPRLGRIIADRYQLDRVLGHGGMGVVYEATHKWTERKLAVKVLQTPVSESDILLKRFFQEARAAAALSHPNVVDVLDLGLDEAGEAYIVLELLPGESLEDRIEREGRLSPKATLDILLPILDALGLAHEHGIVHRDLKPANIFLSHDARGRLIPKLLDFGVAKLLEREDTTLSPKTRPGAMLGTVHYMAPELVLEDDAVTPRCDVWSMGVVLYRCLAGVLPFEAMAHSTLLVKIATQDHDPLALRAPDVPAPIREAVERALVREPAARYAKVGDLVSALVRAADSVGVELDAATRVATSISILPAEPRPSRVPADDSGDDTLAD